MVLNYVDDTLHHTDPGGTDWNLDTITQDLKLALEQMLKDWQCVESPLPQDTTKRRGN